MSSSAQCPGFVSVSDGYCPLGWETFGSSCYLFSRSALSWHEARDWCNGHESHLVILMSDEEWDFVTRLSAGSFYWVGLTDEKSGRWEWVNQTPYVMNRRRWKPGQPDSWTGHGLGPGDEDCAHIHNDGRLNDLHCSTRLPCCPLLAEQSELVLNAPLSFISGTLTSQFDQLLPLSSWFLFMCQIKTF
uniref:C-type lectin domain-containing protein n=1 Tax=Poecilia mexicana TaxID=48701 RepID=A0A3B3Y264_9TELE